MNNQAINFFDDIVKTLSIESESAKFANLSAGVLNEFYANNLQVSNHQKSVETAPVEDVSHTDNNAIAQMDMQTLQKSAHGCTKCPLLRGRKNVVFGAGDVNADLMFIGEVPGSDEDAQGIPFVGEVGQLLTKMINAMQFQRSGVYIANIVKCHPPKNRDPQDTEAEACIPYLQRQIELVSPKVIVILGALPLQYLLNQKGITRLRGKWMDYHGIKTMPTFHPAYLLRNPDAKKDVWTDLQKVMELFGKSHSPIRKR